MTICSLVLVFSSSPFEESYVKRCSASSISKVFTQSTSSLLYNWLPAPRHHTMEHRSSTLCLPRPRGISRRTLPYCAFSTRNSLPEHIHSSPTSASILNTIFCLSFIFPSHTLDWTYFFIFAPCYWFFAKPLTQTHNTHASTRTKHTHMPTHLLTLRP